jgi:hypothetical protein
VTRSRLMSSVATVAVAAVAALVTGIMVHAHSSTTAAPRPVTEAMPSPINTQPYVAAIQVAHRDGLRVWIETDLVRRWLAGPAAFQQAIDAVADEARQPGVVGIKIADELAYHDGLTSPSQVDEFLDASAKALHAAAPGKLILVDLIVPELGCLPDHQPVVLAAAACTATRQREFPQLAMVQVDGYLHRHDVDVVDLSTDLLDPATYTSWGVDLDTAQTAAWSEAGARGWGTLVTLQGRKALAHPGVDADSANETLADLRTFVDIPRRMGSEATDVWTWRQQYEGQTYRLLNPGLKGNDLWTGLVQRHQAGVRMFTHFSPSSVEVSLESDLRLIAQAFTDVFVAAGTG